MLQGLVNDPPVEPVLLSLRLGAAKRRVEVPRSFRPDLPHHVCRTNIAVSEIRAIGRLR